MSETWGRRAPLGWDLTDPTPVGNTVAFLLSDLAGGHHGRADPRRRRVPRHGHRPHALVSCRRVRPGPGCARRATASGQRQCFIHVHARRRARTSGQPRTNHRPHTRRRRDRVRAAAGAATYRPWVPSRVTNEPPSTPSVRTIRAGVAVSAPTSTRSSGSRALPTSTSVVTPEAMSSSRHPARHDHRARACRACRKAPASPAVT